MVCLMLEAVMDDGFACQCDSGALNFLFQLVGVYCFNVADHEVITFHHELGQPGCGWVENIEDSFEQTCECGVRPQPGCNTVEL